MNRLIVTLFSLLFVASCIDRVDLPTRTETPRLVVEGQLTNEASPYVRLTYTGKYTAENQNGSGQYVEKAQVSVSDDVGNTVQLTSTGLGFYQSGDTTFRGRVGRAYRLSVVLSDGKQYRTQPERMPAVPAIDSISAKLIKTGNLTKPYAFDYSVNTTDPGSAKNYYRWTGYGYTTRLSEGDTCSLSNPTNRCNYRCWTLVYTDAINVYSDEAINGNPLRGRSVLQVPVYNITPQLVELQQYGITQANYQFWKLYQQQNARTGSIFDPLPAPVVGNVINSSDPTDVARGYFAVMSITRRRLRQNTYQAPFYGAITSFIATQIIPLHDCRLTYGYDSPTLEPPGW